MSRGAYGRRLGRAALLLVWIAAAAGARAETLYVIEQLVVNVNSAPDASGERIATVKSGEALEVLERSGEQVHVHLADGRDGWVRAGYLSRDEPLRTRLAERETELARLREELGRLRSQPSPPPAAPAVSAGAAPPAQQPAVSAGAQQPPVIPQRPLFNIETDPTPVRVWPWALAAAISGLGAGFALGALTLDRYIRRKYGGLRIY